MSTQTKQFKTEVSQLLDLVIHSLYSKKEIFLRELISNASDAIDRARFEALTDSSILTDGEAFQITLLPNREAGTLTISDNGIGMDAAEVESNIGTIASSGTKAFLAALEEAADKPEMIGQFGVGFYAAFMVAERVEVITHRAGSSAVRWASQGDGSYEIGPAERAERGTVITLTLREKMEEYLEPWRIRNIVKQYSDYITYPVVLLPDPSVKPEEPEADAEDADKPASEPAGPETLNSMKAIWKRGRDEIEESELNEFYKHIAHDFEDPLAHIHIVAEGTTEFRALLFIPATAPYDLFMSERKLGLQLYVRSVFIGDDLKELLPDYLRFVRGVVESSDLPLNVSREMLQDEAVIRIIRKTLVSRILGKLSELQEKQPEDYARFYEAFGRVLKEGLYGDFENEAKLKELVQFPSTFTEDGKLTTLKDYVGRMPASQKEIYTLSADSVEAAGQSPMLETFRARGYEVLFYVDAIDQWVAERLGEYDGKKLRAIDRGEIDLDETGDKEEKKKDAAEVQGRFEPLIGVIKAQLEKDVKDVRISNRLTESACCLVADEYGPNAQMERVMRAFNRDAPPAKRILEINPAHALIEKMLGMAVADKGAAQLADFIELIHAQALLAEGSAIKNPARFSKLLSDLMAQV